MRCMNCGWENPDNLQKCEKCNSPLESHMAQVSSFHHASEHNSALKGTISEQQVFPSSAPTSGESTCCPKCGYPLRDNMHHCPNCGVEIHSRNSGTNPYNEVHKAAPNHKATVNPWANPNAGRTFKLEPIAWAGENGAPSIQSYTGESVELNRDNTDPSNNTITSNVQAKMSCENGVWTLEDKSSQGTTFIQAKRRIELADGDIIMLGNRRFIFKAE